MFRFLLMRTLYLIFITYPVTAILVIPVYIKARPDIPWSFFKYNYNLVDQLLQRVSVISTNFYTRITNDIIIHKLQRFF